MGQVTRDRPGAISPNRVVAFNLRRARDVRGWTQEEAAERLTPYLRVKWSSSQFSVAERWSPKEGQKVRRFDAEDLVAFALAFDMPVGFFLDPPETTDRIALAGGRGAEVSSVRVRNLLGLGVTKWNLERLRAEIAATEKSVRALQERLRAASRRIDDEAVIEAARAPGIADEEPERQPQEGEWPPAREPTPGQLRVILELAFGSSPLEDIAERLGVSVETAKEIVRDVFDRLVHSEQEPQDVEGGK